MAHVTALVKHLSEPWFSLVAEGKKTSEGRLNTSCYAKLQQQDRILFHNGEGPERREVVVEVVSTVQYDSFAELIVGEGLQHVLPSPDVETVEQGVAVYRRFYSEEAELKSGVVAIRIRVQQ
jgi:ASC-1-like (ASCH) protein